MFKKCSKPDCQNKNANSEGLLHLDQFNNQKRGMYGKRPECKNCSNHYAQVNYLNNINTYSQHRQEYYKLNKVNENNYRKLWRKQNPGLSKAQQARRRASKLNATPLWAKTGPIAEQIENFYINCPDGYQVDHIHPLQGSNFKGLHVPWNLQYLTQSQNSSKGNRLIT